MPCALPSTAMRWLFPSINVTRKCINLSQEQEFLVHESISWIWPINKWSVFPVWLFIVASRKILSHRHTHRGSMLDLFPLKLSISSLNLHIIYVGIEKALVCENSTKWVLIWVLVLYKISTKYKIRLDKHTTHAAHKLPWIGLVRLIKLTITNLVQLNNEMEAWIENMKGPIRKLYMLSTFWHVCDLWKLIWAICTVQSPVYERKCNPRGGKSQNPFWEAAVLVKYFLQDNIWTAKSRHLHFIAFLSNNFFKDMRRSPQKFKKYRKNNFLNNLLHGEYFPPLPMGLFKNNNHLKFKLKSAKL